MLQEIRNVFMDQRSFYEDVNWRLSHLFQDLSYKSKNLLTKYSEEEYSRSMFVRNVVNYCNVSMFTALFLFSKFRKCPVLQETASPYCTV